jgi:hypothetical protein
MVKINYKDLSRMPPCWPQSLLNNVADSSGTGKFPLSHPISFSYYVSIFWVTKIERKKKRFSLLVEKVRKETLRKYA